VIQQGRVFKLKTKGADGQPLWAYRYRLEGRGPARSQVGGFASGAEAQKALCKALERLSPGGCGQAGRACGHDHARGARRGIPRAASGRAGHDRQAALASRQGDRGARGEATGGSVPQRWQPTADALLTMDARPSAVEAAQAASVSRMRRSSTRRRSAELRERDAMARPGVRQSSRKPPGLSVSPRIRGKRTLAARTIWPSRGR